MKSTYLLLGSAILLLMNSCSQHAYFQSPFHTNTSGYKTIPMHSDRRQSAIYADGLLSLGGANEQWRDQVTGFMGSIYRSHSSKYIQGYYGLTGLIGGYRVKPYLSDWGYSNASLDDTLINTMVGRKQWAGWGVNGGVCVTLPFDKHEWRVVEIEGSWQKEYGQYLDFRQKLPEKAANLVSHSRYYFTLAVGTDLVFQTGDGQFGYKAAGVFSTRTLHGYSRDLYPFTRKPGYFSQTLHATIDKITAYTQLNLGTFAGSWQIGISYRLGR